MSKNSPPWYASCINFFCGITHTRTQWVYLAVVLCLVFIGGTLVGRNEFNKDITEGKVDFSEVNTKYKFIDPLLFCQDQNVSNKSITQIEDEVGAYISQEKTTNDIIDAAFYFKDLNGGPSAIVNPTYQSSPSSLLKLPIAIGVYQRAEADPSFLQTTITMPANLKGIDANQNEHFTAPESIQPNTPYTVEELVRYMLQYSDNTAVYMLGNLFTEQQLQTSFSQLGLAAPTASGQGYTETVKQFASFFRVLYNGTYISQDDSEHLLSILSHSTFMSGIVAGLPQDMVVAHKFGETSSPDGTVQLNDCGIVYKPDHPYLLCVMTTGTNYDALATVISHISNMLYHSVVSSD